MVTSRSVVEDLLASAAALRELGRWAGVEVALRQALEAVTSDTQGAAVLEEMMQVPGAVRGGSPAWQVLNLWVWCVNRCPQEILDFSADLTLPPEGAVYRTWALARLGREVEALALLEEVWPVLTGATVGFAWRVRAQALASLGTPGWREAFRAAAGLLQGRRRSLSLAEEGHWLNSAGLSAHARETWREALAGFEGDVFHQAWLRYNLGVSAFRDGAPEAEHHFLALMALSRRAEAKRFASRAWCGLGAFRRLHGEWSRAEYAYHRALHEAGGDCDDEVEARWGMGHLRRLQGLPEVALEEFGRGRARGGERARWLHVDEACAHAQAGHPAQAFQALAQGGDALGAHAGQVAVVRAELARQSGRGDEARLHLRDVEQRGTWVREERTCFPALFTLLEEAGVVAAVTETRCTCVEVRAGGVLQVLVNGRAVPLAPTGRAAELLVALLELDGGASVEALTGWLYPGPGTRTRPAAQRLSALTRELREVLGWRESVQARRGAYQLDPATEWVYDVANARQQAAPLPAFMTGVYSDWVVRRQACLDQPTLWNDID
ncbi:DNA-binding protein [Deinococcus planocerae]|uniref:DNA-binding protein n=1 Tax=Deinococcus planocerae TaxID=1737569 RepID=UPI000C7EB3A9|nr:DNA-binding protein [Deinococcus planocerae]